MRRLYFQYFIFIALFIGACDSDEPAAPPPASPESTVDALQKSVEQYPDSTILIQELIQAYRNAGNYDSAISLAQREAKDDTSNAYFWNILATLQYEIGDTAKTVEALEHAIAIYPIPEYYVALGTVYAEMKNKNALFIADILLDRLAEKNYDDAYFIKGLYYNYAGKYNEAIEVLDSCLALDFTYMYAYREKAIALYELKKYRQAVQVLKRAVTLQNNFDEGYFWMGKAYEKMHLRDSAVIAFQNALLYDKNYIEAQKQLDSLLHNQQPL